MRMLLAFFFCVGGLLGILAAPERWQTVYEHDASAASLHVVVGQGKLPGGASVGAQPSLTKHPAFDMR